MRSLRVRLVWGPDDEIAVGTLVEAREGVWFTYDASFLETGLQIAPLRLVADHTRPIPHDPAASIPIPGVFDDARPDGWGLKLLHRAFAARGRVASSVSPLDELAALGDAALGALAFEPSTAEPGPLHDAVELSALARHARRVWDDEVETVLPELVQVAGSSGGARPKALIGLPVAGGPGVRAGEGRLPEGWAHWLVKFPTSRDDPDVGARERAWMHLAARAGLEVPATRLLALEGLGRAFAVRRFDRPRHDTRRHMLSAAGALDVDFQRAFADYEHLLRATHALCADDPSQGEALFRLAAFNVCAVNHDDHLKNLAWLMDRDGTWRLAPAFDLTYAPHPRGERSTTVAGRGRLVDRAALLDLADRGGVPHRRAVAILDEVTTATATVHDALAEVDAHHPVSRAAAEAVLQATARVASSA